MVPNKQTKQRRIKRVERAINAMVDIQDLGGGCQKVSAILDLLNLLACEYERES
jgi:hypothetical protein